MNPLLSAEGLTKTYGARIGCRDVSFDLFPGEVLAIVGESGSGKTTLLRCLSGHVAASAGRVIYTTRDGKRAALDEMSEAERRLLMRTDWGFVHLDAREGLRRGVSRVEIPEDRIDDSPWSYSGGMRQRLQIARNLVTSPRLVFMDEPTGGLDVSVQARLLDLIRGLVKGLGLAAVVVTHDLAVARLLSSRMMVMQQGRVIEEGLTDQILEDPQAAYSQLLVSSVLQV
jgi:putative phosphonate transport system ATP-binding protein